MITYTIPRSHCRHLDIDRHFAHSMEYIKYVRYHPCVFICTSMKQIQDTGSQKPSRKSQKDIQCFGQKKKYQ